jgi:hypothetical protein
MANTRIITLLIFLFGTTALAQSAQLNAEIEQLVLRVMDKMQQELALTAPQQSAVAAIFRNSFLYIGRSQQQMRELPCPEMRTRMDTLRLATQSRRSNAVGEQLSGQQLARWQRADSAVQELLLQSPIMLRIEQNDTRTVREKAEQVNRLLGTKLDLSAGQLRFNLGIWETFFRRMEKAEDSRVYLNCDELRREMLPIREEAIAARDQELAEIFTAEQFTLFEQLKAEVDHRIRHP